MSQQRVPFDVRDEALSGLRDWWADRFDASFFNHAGAYVTQSDTRYSGNNAITAIDTNHYYTVHGSGVDETIGSSDKFVITALDAAVEKARTLTPAIRPASVDGKDMYAVVLHPYQVTDLRTSTTTGQWLDITKAAMQGGTVSDNPIYTGALGVYNGCVLHSDARVTQGLNSSTSAAITTVRRALFLGAQAMMLGFGRDNSAERYSWVEELFDSKPANDNRVALAA